MDSLTVQFERAQRQVQSVAAKLSNHEFLTGQDFTELVRVLNELDLGRQRGIRILEQAGMETTGCQDLDRMVELLEFCRAQQEQEEKQRRIRDTVAGFLSIEAVEEEHRSELSRYQQELEAFSGEKLEEMEKAGELEPYRLFLASVRSQRPNRAVVAQLKNTFGYQLAFALLAGQLEYHGPDLDVDPASPVEDEAEPEPEEPAPAQEEPAAEEVPQPEPEAPAEPEIKTAPAEPPAPEPPPKPRGPVVASSTQLLFENDFPYYEAWDGFADFCRNVQEMDNACHILLLALSRFGVLDLETAMQFTILMGWDAPWREKEEAVAEQEERSLQRQMATVPRKLLRRNLIAEYVREGKPTLYCLNEYSYRVLQREDLFLPPEEFLRIELSGGRHFHVPVGHHDVYGKEEMEESVLDGVMEQNKALIRYFTFLRRAWEAQVFDNGDMVAVLDSIAWQSGQYTIRVPGVDKLNLCTLYDSMSQFPRSSDLFYPGSGGALFLTPERPEGPIRTRGPAFYCNDSELYIWERGWEKLMEIPEPAPEPEPEPEAEPEQATDTEPAAEPAAATVPETEAEAAEESAQPAEEEQPESEAGEEISMEEPEESAETEPEAEAEPEPEAEKGPEKPPERPLFEVFPEEIPSKSEPEPEPVPAEEAAEVLEAPAAEAAEPEEETGEADQVSDTVPEAEPPIPPADAAEAAASTDEDPEADAESEQPVEEAAADPENTEEPAAPGFPIVEEGPDLMEYETTRKN